MLTKKEKNSLKNVNVWKDSGKYVEKDQSTYKLNNCNSCGGCNGCGGGGCSSGCGG